MLNPNSRSSAALILGLGGISLGFFLLCTECFFDLSIMTDKLLFTSIVGASFLIPMLYIMTGFKKSALVSLLFMIALASACILQYFNRSSLGIFFVEQKDAMAILRTRGMRNTEEINQACAGWTTKNGVTLLIYGQRKAAIDPSETPNLTYEMIQECRENFLAEVINKTERRKSENDAVVVKFNLSQVPVKNKADEMALAEMLDSIYFSKFKRNTIIVARVGNYKNLTNIGFSRTIEDETAEGKKEKAENERKLKGEEENEETKNIEETKEDEKKLDEETKENEKKVDEETKEDEKKLDEETKEDEKKLDEETKKTEEKNNTDQEKTDEENNKKETNQPEIKDKLVPEKTTLTPTV